MQKFHEFIFTQYNFNLEKGELSLRYSLDNKINFEEKVFFDVMQIDFAQIDQIALDKAFFNLHLIGGISYYKTYCPTELSVESGELSEKQIEFWEKIYKRGLGEFFYRNGIDFRELVRFKSVESSNFKVQSSNEIQNYELPRPVCGRAGRITNCQEDKVQRTLEKHLGSSQETLNQPFRCLVPIGGGKDSLVTAELLKKAGVDFTFFSLGDSLPQKETAEIVGKERLIVRRELSPNLFELNKQGAFNGHVPISAYIAFLSIATSLLYGYDFIVLSNEHSANYGNLDYLGMNINHQYSKSLGFEKDFNQYVAQNITSKIHYFSLLRPFYELKIAEIFSKYPQYFQKFTSCNSNFKLQASSHKFQAPESRLQTLWCCDCPKCVFVYAILAPFISKAQMLEIFGENLFEKENLRDLFLELLGAQKNKPFECVGTAEEVAVAFYLTSQKKEFQNDFMIKIFIQEILPQIQNMAELKDKVFEIYLEGSFVPEAFCGVILTEIDKIQGVGSF